MDTGKPDNRVIGFPLFDFNTHSMKVLTIRFESVKINRVVTMHGQKKFYLEKPFASAK